MTRSHPPALLHQVEATLRERCELPSGARVAVAVSGGPDSMALLDALERLRANLELHLAVLSIDHGLRPEAEREVALVEGFAREREVPFFSSRLNLEAGGNLQARARAARYEALQRLAGEWGGPEVFLATAHQLEDRAETVLLRLLRGTSPAGLAVLAPRDGQLLRPLVTTPRRAVLEHAERHQIPFVLDPSNRDPRFLRVRVREQLLPLFDELAPGAAERLAHLAEEARTLDEPLGLNREQREQLRRALRAPGGPVEIRLPRGLRLRREP